MSDRADITDEQLVAWLDGVLDEVEVASIARAVSADPALAARVEALGLETTGLKAGFDAMLAEAPAIEVPLPPVPANANRPLWQAVAAAALLAIGLGAGWGLSRPAAPDWHMAVAQYQALYTGATVTAVPQTDAQRDAGLANVSAAIGLPLDPDTIAVEGLRFQRAQILQHEGQPLAQLVYLDARDRPVAFCIMREAVATGKPDTRELAGMPAATWTNGTHGFILIGPVAPDLIGTTAEQLHRNMAG